MNSFGIIVLVIAVIMLLGLFVKLARILAMIVLLMVVIIILTLTMIGKNLPKNPKGEPLAMATVISGLE